MSLRCVLETWRSERRELSEGDFFRALPESPFALLYGQGRHILLAEDPLLRLDHPDTGAFHFERTGDVGPLLPDFIGYATYEYGYGLDPVLAPLLREDLKVPGFSLTLYGRLRLYDRAEKTLYTAQRHLERELPPSLHGLGRGAFSARKIFDSDEAGSYCAKVSRIREAIRSGDVYQVNLTRQETWQVSGGLDEFAKRLFFMNPAPYSALVSGSHRTIISSSPECFFRIQDGRLLTRPIKGTAPRHAQPEADEAGRQWLLESAKNRSELAMIVDLLRNDLTRVCRIPSVTVDAFPVLESFANVHHLVADISGALGCDVTLAQVFRALFPGGSITGCPKLSAMALIRELEDFPRDIYTGALGWCSFDLRQAEFAIPIRTAWTDADMLRFGVGGGVVWDSDPKDEYEETVHKGRSLVSCLRSA